MRAGAFQHAAESRGAGNLTNTAFRRFTPIAKCLDFEFAAESIFRAGRSFIPRAQNRGSHRASGFFQPAPAGKFLPTFLQHAAYLMGPIAQFLTGAFPALFRRGSMANTGHRQRATAMRRATRPPAASDLHLASRAKFFHADLISVARRGLFSAESPRRCGGYAARRGRCVRIEMDSPSADLKGNLFSYPETRRTISDLVGAAARRVAAVNCESRSADSVPCFRHPGKYGPDRKRIVGLEEIGECPDAEGRAPS